MFYLYFLKIVKYYMEAYLLEKKILYLNIEKLKKKTTVLSLTCLVKKK